MLVKQIRDPDTGSVCCSVNVFYDVIIVFDKIVKLELINLLFFKNMRLKVVFIVITSLKNGVLIEFFKPLIKIRF